MKKTRLIHFLPGVLIAFALVLLNLHGGSAPPGFDHVRETFAGSYAVLLDRHGQPVHELRTDLSRRALDWTGLADISPALVKAVVACEDRRFFGHRGVDWRSLGGSIVRGLTGRGFRGASTITMQLAGQLYPELAVKKGRRSPGQKIRQLRAALAIEKSWTKDQILETYLNLIFFRGELQGIAAAAWGLFRKSPGGLNQAEALLLACLIRSPNAPAGQVVGRASRLAMTASLPVNEDELNAAGRNLSPPYGRRPSVQLAPHLAQKRLKAGVRSRRSTLEAGLQRYAAEELRQSVAELSTRNVRDGALLAVDNASGEILAYVANTGDTASAPYVDGVMAPRQTGSALKPFLYALAIDRRILTAASLLDDSPLEIPTGRGIYRPENYDRRFRGLVTARAALASSLNIPAVRTLMLTGEEAFAEVLGRLGIRDLQEGSHYGLSLALGSASVSLYELVNAYRALANGGVWSPLTDDPDRKSEERKTVFSPAAAFIVSDILADREARSGTFGLENPLATRFRSSVKTGTSKDMRDNWCVGYSGRYTVGVWVGNFPGEPMWNVSGMSGAAPVWMAVMNQLHRNDPGQAAPALPPGVVTAEVMVETEGRRRQEYFLNGTQQAAMVRPAVTAAVRIAYPAPDTIIALDPDIPPDRQKVFFRTAPPDAALRWALDGRDIGPADSAPAWSPVRGKHALALVDAENRVVDQVLFSVR
ncbi:MAG: penicillin-binding protein 1C [Thermodesulfobacteriota bacterium]